MKLTDDMRVYIDNNIDDLILKTFESPSMTPELALDVWEYYYIKVIEKTEKYKQEIDYLKFIIKQQEDEIEDLQNYILELREVDKE